MKSNCNSSLAKVIPVVKQKKQKEPVSEFKKRKIMAQKLPPRYIQIGRYYDDERFLRWADRVNDCGNYLEFYNWEKAGLKIKKANFCGDRLCPICNWRRSLRMFAKLSKIIQSEQYKNTDYRNLFLTLTVRNCNIDKLHAAIKNISYFFLR